SGRGISARVHLARIPWGPSRAAPPATLQDQETGRPASLARSSRADLPIPPELDPGPLRVLGKCVLESWQPLLGACASRSTLFYHVEIPNMVFLRPKESRRNKPQRI